MRAFLDKPVPHSDIKEILSDAVYAPTAADAQPWSFVVVEEPTLIEAACAINPFAEWGGNAPLGILVCGDQDMERQPGTWAQDCAAVTQNILLLVHDRGLGATWTSVYPIKSRVEGYRSLFGLPQSVFPFAFVLIGYPGRQPQERSRTLDGRLHFNLWEGRSRDIYTSFSKARETIRQKSTLRTKSD